MLKDTKNIPQIQNSWVSLWPWIHPQERIVMEHIEVGALLNSLAATPPSRALMGTELCSLEFKQAPRTLRPQKFLS